MTRKKIVFKTMLSSIILLILVYILLYQYPKFTTITANATGEKAIYARILSGCYLYEQANTESGLFILPESYYVKIRSTGGTFHQISYLDEDDFATPVQGYVLATSVQMLPNYTPQNPYLKYTITVNFKISTYALLEEIRLELPFYGISMVNTRVFNYVNYNKQIVAVDAKACSVVNYPKHPDSLINTGGNNNINNNATAQSPQFSYTPLIVTAIIVALCLLGLGISYFIFSGNKKHKPIQVFDELDEF